MAGDALAAGLAGALSSAVMAVILPRRFEPAWGIMASIVARGSSADKILERAHPSFVRTSGGTGRAQAPRLGSGRMSP